MAAIADRSDGHAEAAGSLACPRDGLARYYWPETALAIHVQKRIAAPVLPAGGARIRHAVMDTLDYAWQAQKAV
ncbi:hypothetical protein GCM10010869_19250 [Mesorhizobium tianshanense]|nr:hypothetical protein GCM10010869_19250 [Mesorhizobium tianshanense]